MNYSLLVIYWPDDFCKQVSIQVKSGAESRNCQVKTEQFSTNLQISQFNSSVLIVTDVEQIQEALLLFKSSKQSFNSISIIFISKNSKTPDWNSVSKTTQMYGFTLSNSLIIRLSGFFKFIGKFEPLNEVDLARASAIGEKIAYSLSSSKPKSKDTDDPKTRIPGYLR